MFWEEGLLILIPIRPGQDGYRYLFCTYVYVFLRRYVVVTVRWGCARGVRSLVADVCILFVVFDRLEVLQWQFRPHDPKVDRLMNYKSI